MTINHVEFYVHDVATTESELATTYGFETTATSGSQHGDDDHISVAMRHGSIHLVLTQPRSSEHVAHEYLARHGAGVADIALRTPDVRGSFERAVLGGARQADRPDTIHGHGGVRHTFVEDRGPDVVVIPGVGAVGGTGSSTGVGLRAVDHFAFCLNPGELTAAADFYTAALDFKLIFEERIAVGAQAMLSKVVQSASRAVTLTLIEPDVSSEPGQIDAFLRDHGGPGVQHIAFRCDDAVATVGKLAARGVEFLDIPDAYYRLLGEHLSLATHTTDELRRFGILVDEDHDGQLFQIFTKSTHPRRTFFYEVIERHGATTFGSGNIRALYEAVEAEQAQSRVTP
jgi:4-hydroxymandelate synthase